MRLADLIDQFLLKCPDFVWNHLSQPRNSQMNDITQAKTLPMDTSDNSWDTKPMPSHVTTSNPPSPPETITSEADMGMIKDFFARAANTIVEAAGLRKDIAELRVSVEGMKVEIAHVRDQNRWLDEQLANVRKARDQVMIELDAANQDRQSLTIQRDKDKAAIESMQAHVEGVMRDRDAGWAKFDSLKEHFGKLQAETDSIRFDRDRLATELTNTAQQVSILNEQLGHVNNDLRHAKEENKQVWIEHNSLNTRYETIKTRLDSVLEIFTSPTQAR